MRLDVNVDAVEVCGSPVERQEHLKNPHVMVQGQGKGQWKLLFQVRGRLEGYGGDRLEERIPVCFCKPIRDYSDLEIIGAILGSLQNGLLGEELERQLSLPSISRRNSERKTINLFKFIEKANHCALRTCNPNHS